MLVVDATAVTELLLNRPAGDAVGHHLREHEFDLHAPHLLDVEVLSALRGRVMRPLRAGTRRSRTSSICRSSGTATTS
jgi:predicted nucleic acid-binding protein